MLCYAFWMLCIHVVCRLHCRVYSTGMGGDQVPRRTHHLQGDFAAPVCLPDGCSSGMHQHYTVHDLAGMREERVVRLASSDAPVPTSRDFTGSVSNECSLLDPPCLLP